MSTDCLDRDPHEEGRSHTDPGLKADRATMSGHDGGTGASIDALAQSMGVSVRSSRISFSGWMGLVK